MRTFAPLNQFFCALIIKYSLCKGGACNLPPLLKNIYIHHYIFIQNKEENALKSGTSLKPCAVFFITFALHSERTINNILQGKG